MEVDERPKACGQDEGGRLWDVLWMFRVAAARRDGEPVTQHRSLHCVTIMLPDED